MIVKVFAVLAVALFGVCSANPTSRVVGGSDAEPGQFPHQISLRVANSHICGGSIINESFILTAAHCVVEFGITPKPAENFTIRAGSNNRLTGGVVREVKKITVHENYANFINDLAVLELEEPLVFSCTIQPIELEENALEDGTEVIISGWGLTENKGDDIPVYLQYNTLKTISKTKCAMQTGMYNDALLCLSHTKGNGACNGDSGGPAVYNGKLVGVASFVFSGCGTSSPDGYVKVSASIDWIRAHTKQNSECLFR